MLDIRFLRDHVDQVRDGVAKKGNDTAPIDEALRLDDRRRHLIQQSEALKSRKNDVSAQVARMKSRGEDAATLIAEMRTVADQVKTIDDELKTIEEGLRVALLQIPNIPHPSVPDGKTPADNQAIAMWGEEPTIDFKPLSHWDLMEKLTMIDFPRGTKITGAGFPVFVGKGAQL